MGCLRMRPGAIIGSVFPASLARTPDPAFLRCVHAHVQHRYQPSTGTVAFGHPSIGRLFPYSQLRPSILLLALFAASSKNDGQKITPTDGVQRNHRTLTQVSCSMRQSSTSSEACICAGTQTVKEQNRKLSDDAFLDCLSLLARECASVGKWSRSDNFGEALAHHGC